MRDRAVASPDTWTSCPSAPQQRLLLFLGTAVVLVRCDEGKTKGLFEAAVDEEQRDELALVADRAKALVVKVVGQSVRGHFLDHFLGVLHLVGSGRAGPRESGFPGNPPRRKDAAAVPGTRHESPHDSAFDAARDRSSDTGRSGHAGP